ncbi:ceramide kinase [Episyrphus balteatus]|uniref:ceramide kinase n=1 Tax=Episyrphus balteatus TaxID=286459 RepID=UPI0024867AE6|nr:ceramide kinase [Episyrphus balteatus]
MYSPQTDILLNTFLIKKKRYRALLNYGTIIYEKEETNNSKQNDKTIIPVSDVLAFEQSSNQPAATSEECNQSSEHYSSSSTTQESSSSPSASGITSDSNSNTKSPKEYLTIHYAKRVIKSPQDCNRWQKQTVVFQSTDSTIINNWYAVLQKILSEQNRLRNVLVFINPFGGQKRGLETYEKYCKPIFQLAKVDASCIISQRANQIHDIVMTTNLDQYDAICCVGGDGTFAEVVNGLLFRTMKDLDLDPHKPKYIPKPKIPVAVIPAGSTDTVAFSLHGTCDVATAAIHMVLGQKRGLDICSVQNPNGLIRFCASVMSYGYLGDIALQSEKYRWMGTKRYEYAGFKSILMNTSYPAEIRILLSNSDVEHTKSDQALDQSVAGSNQELNDKKCFVNCQRCSSSSFLANEVYKVHDSNPDLEEKCPTSSKCNNFNKSISSEKENDTLQGTTTNTKNNTCDNLPAKSNSKLIVTDKSNGFSKNPYSSEEEAVTPTTTSTLVASPSNQMVWKAIKGGFFMISGANITCACSRSPNGMAKFSHLGDGSIDLILVHKTSLINNIRLLIKMVNKTGDIRDLPFVEVYRTKQFYFRAQPNEEFAWDGSSHPINDEIPSRTSQWNCDGEIVHDLEIFMSSHCQLLDVFMRGPYPFHEELPGNACCPGFCQT